MLAVGEIVLQEKDMQLMKERLMVIEEQLKHFQNNDENEVS